MGFNYQDVIRDVHDPTTHSFKTTGSAAATLFAVVNTGAPGQASVVLDTGKNWFGLATVYVGGPTLFAVVNTAAAGQASVVLDTGKNWIGLATVNIGNAVGNATLNPSPNYIGLATIDIGTIKAWPDPKTYIGLVTITGSLAAASGNVTLDAGSKTGLIGTVTIQDGGNSITIDGNVGVLGNVTLSDAKTYIGLVTSTIGNNPVLGAGVNSIGFATTFPAAAWPDPKGYIGLVTITGSLAAASGNVTLDAGSKTGLVGTVTIQDGGNSITIDGNVGILGNVTLSDSKTYVGLTTTTLGVGTTFIGLVTAVTRNAGTNKTLVHFPIGFSAASQVTVAAPTNANSMYITNLVINSNATVRLTIKSGVTYMTGNASIGVTLNPGGGFVLTGAPDSPSWIGLPSGAIVIEKLDLTATAAQLGGHLIYFQE